MEPEKQDDSEVLETTENTVEEQKQETTDEETSPEAPAKDEEKEALRRENEELKKKNSKLFERAKKQPQSSDGLSALDAVAIAKADIHEDDINEVVDFAKFKNIPVKDALKNPTLRSILKDNAENRRTAQATHIKGGQRVAAEPSNEDYLAKAERGEQVDSTEGMQGIFKARLARKLPQKR